jgi:hypothetical protein
MVLHPYPFRFGESGLQRHSTVQLEASPLCFAGQAPEHSKDRESFVPAVFFLTRFFL